MKKFLKKVFSIDPVKKLEPLVEQINKLESEFEKFDNEDFAKKTAAWKEEVQKKVEDGNDLQNVLDEYLPQAFALVREASKRTIGQRHYDVQLMGGIVLHQGQIAEMKTGEGKTLASTLPVYLNALSGKGVHVVTVNDYLAKRDASWMGQIYHFLGLSVGSIQQGASYKYDPDATTEEITEITDTEKEGVVLDVENLVPCNKREAYEADVTYGTNNEFGFDYLRDNMVMDKNQMAQRDLYFAIIDEVDSILIDEARTPLIISAPDAESTERYKQFAKLVNNLKENKDFNLDEKHKAVTLTEEGIHTLEKLLGVDNIYVEGGVTTVHHIEQALKAKTLFKKDRDYVVKEGQVVIVDEFTGRLMEGRRYSEGLHQAIEAKEGVNVQQESKTMATITFQNFFRMYEKLSGMTGTAATEAEEFHKIYGLGVVVIPTHRPIVRDDMADLVYKTEQGKFKAAAKAIKELHEKGQPVLVGTTSIDKNEQLSEYLKREGVPHELLNAKNHEREAHIIARAGEVGGVTVATNMAGRGVDIILGGNPPNPKEAGKVKELGGLHVIGTERHDSRRIDNQLRGRSGRQGDPGSSQFYLSLDDDLMRLFGGDRMKNLVGSMKLPEDQPITHSMVSKSIESAQKKIEGLNFDKRKHVVEFDDVVNKHRTAIYNKRGKILKGKLDLKSETIEALKGAIDDATKFHSGATNGSVDKKEIKEILNTIFPVDDTVSTIIATEVDPEQMSQKLQDHVIKLYEKREQELGESVSRSIEKFLWLRMIDQFWQEHLNTMEHLRDSVRLRAYGQRDPLVEYKREGYALFERLLASIEKHVAHSVFKVTVQMEQAQQQMQEQRAAQQTGLAAQADGQQEQNQEPTDRNRYKGEKVGRNDPCPCGATKSNGKPVKYKHCHGK